MHASKDAFVLRSKQITSLQNAMFTRSYRYIYGECTLNIISNQQLQESR